MIFSQQTSAGASDNSIAFTKSYVRYPSVMKLLHWVFSGIVTSTTIGLSAVIDYQNVGNFQTISFTENGVTVTGSGTLSFLNLNGVGVVGGINDTMVDPNGGGPAEFLDFTADGANLFTLFDIGSFSAVNINGGDIDAFTIEGFDGGGASVGTFNYEGFITDIYAENLVARLGGAPLKQIRIVATGDAFRIGTIEFETIAVAAPVPEPEATLLVLLGSGMLFRRRRSIGLRN